jgi:hypothetical protein
MVHGERRASIVLVSLIRCSVQLFPKFSPQAPVSWLSSNVLDNTTTFYVNPFSDRFLYSLIYLFLKFQILINNFELKAVISKLAMII